MDTRQFFVVALSMVMATNSLSAQRLPQYPSRAAAPGACSLAQGQVARAQGELFRTRAQMARLQRVIGSYREGIDLQRDIEDQGWLHSVLGSVAGGAKVTKGMSDMILSIMEPIAPEVTKAYDIVDSAIGAGFAFHNGEGTKGVGTSLGGLSRTTKGADKMWGGLAGRSARAVDSALKGDLIAAGADFGVGLADLADDAVPSRGLGRLKGGSKYVKNTREAYHGLREMTEMSGVREEIAQRSRSTQSLFEGHIARKHAEIERLRQQEYAMQMELSRATARNQACGSMTESPEGPRYGIPGEGSDRVRQNENRTNGSQRTAPRPAEKEPYDPCSAFYLGGDSWMPGTPAKCRGWR